MTVQHLQSFKIGMVAGEQSGDTLGSRLIQDIKKQLPHAQFIGIGGEQMQQAGLQSLYPLERLSVMGLFEVLGRLRELFAIKNGLVKQFTHQKIDLFVGIDAPDFNLRLSHSLQPYHIPCVQYVSPSVWAWRQNRIVKIKASVNAVLCLLPFEAEFYHKHQLPSYYVGHPLVQEIEPVIHKGANKLAMGYQENQTIVGLLPGSRRGEIERLLPAMLQAAQLMLQKNEDEYKGVLQFIIPAANTKCAQYIDAIVQQNEFSHLKPYIQMIAPQAAGNTGRMVMQASDCVILASGTAAFEAMLVGVPMVVIYKLNALTYWLAKKLVKIPYYSLPNILAKREIVPELIQYQANPTNIAQTANAILYTQAGYNQKNNFAVVRAQLQADATQSAADVIVNVLLKQKQTHQNSATQVHN